MDAAEVLERYHGMDVLSLAPGLHAHTKPGVRGYPGLPDGLDLLLERADLNAENLLDATGSAGMAALVAGDGPGRRTVLESSAAALVCARSALATHSGVELAAGLPWQAIADSFDVVCLLPQTDRGSLRVAAELAGAQSALRPGGRCWLAMHKDQGAKRYEKQARELFGALSVISRQGGWRLVEARKTETRPEPVADLRFHAAGFDLTAPPGVFAAGKLDPGTALLLEALDTAELAGQRVLDLGCGYGVLAMTAALAGAVVTALDDDLGAVRATYANAGRYGLDLRCLHSDIDSALGPDEHFDAVLTNPPFHVGRQVRPLVPRAFLAAAHEHLRPGGMLTLVANQALPYEAELAGWAEVKELARDGRFKVLRAVRGRD